MTVPRHEGKHDERALVTAERSVEYHYDDPPAVPTQVVLCFHDGPFEYVEESYETTAFRTFAEGLALAATGGSVGVVRVPGVGAPVTSLVMEELIELGTETVISVGHVGGVDPGLGIGDTVVVDRALRDEGTSHHYLEPAAYATATPALVDQFESTLTDAGTAYEVGATWTTDAPHRETASEVKRYREEGVLTVDMEAAAVFAIASLAPADS